MSGNIAVSAEGARELKQLAEALPESSETINRSAGDLENSFEELKETLGPHTNDIKEIIDIIRDAQSKAQTSVMKVYANLQKVSSKIMEIVEKNFSAAGGGRP